MKKSVILLGLVTIFAFGCSKAPAPSVPVVSAPEPQVDQPVSQAGVFFPGVFLTEIPKSDFKNLKLTDFPSMDGRGRLARAEVWNNRLFILGYPHVAEYNWKGEMLAYTNTAQVECADDFAILKNSLFVACYNKGIYEINLESNKIVNFYDQKNGLTNLQNLQLSVDGKYLWVGTFEGVAKIDAESQKVAFYGAELKAGGTKFNARVHARNGEVWAQVIASAYSEGGASQYDYKSDTWTAYGPTYFKTKETDRIDFNQFIVSDKGIFTWFQDGGPHDMVLKKFDPTNDSWTTVYTADYNNFEGNVAKYLPPTESYTNSELVYSQPGASHPEMKVFDGSKWQSFAFKWKQTNALVFFNDQYYLLTESGLEVLGKEDKFPKLIAPSDKVYSGQSPEQSALFITDDQKYLVFLSNDMNDMMGEWADFSIGVYNLTSGKFFDRDIDLKEFMDSLPAGSREVQHTYKNDVLTLNFANNKSLTIDLAK